MSIPDKLTHIKEVKKSIEEKIQSTGQNTNVPFRDYTKLIDNIPNTGAITPSQVNELTELAIEISGEKA